MFGAFVRREKMFTFGVLVDRCRIKMLQSVGFRFIDDVMQPHSRVVLMLGPYDIHWRRRRSHSRVSSASVCVCAQSPGQCYCLHLHSVVMQICGSILYNSPLKSNQLICAQRTTNKTPHDGNRYGVHFPCSNRNMNVVSFVVFVVAFAWICMRRRTWYILTGRNDPKVSKLMMMHSL